MKPLPAEGSLGTDREPALVRTSAFPLRLNSSHMTLESLASPQISTKRMRMTAEVCAHDGLSTAMPDGRGLVAGLKIVRCRRDGRAECRGARRRNSRD
jgi:hypothetical protein